MDVRANIPDFGTPIVGADGRVNEVWWRFLMQLFNRTGGTTGSDGNAQGELILTIEGLLNSTVAPASAPPSELNPAPLLHSMLLAPPPCLAPDAGLTAHHGKQDDPEHHALATTTQAGFMSPADKAALSDAVTDVTGTAPIVSSGGNTPAISITPATPAAAGSMSAADKTRLDQLEATDAPTFAGLNLTNGQITFPAVAVPSGGATVLDDYREVPFTPALTFGGASTGITYSTQAGVAVKIGRLVWAAAAITLTSKGTATGAATITGYPFSNTVLSQTPASIGAFLNMAGLTSPPFGTLITTTLSLFDSGATGQTALDDTNFTNTTTLRVVCVYGAT